jgi:hypothetical protein
MANFFHISNRLTASAAFAVFLLLAPVLLVRDCKGALHSHLSEHYFLNVH